MGPPLSYYGKIMGATQSASRSCDLEETLMGAALCRGKVRRPYSDLTRNE